MARKRKPKAKPLQSHDQENFSLAELSSSPRSPTREFDNRERSFPKDVESVSAKPRQQATNSLALNAGSEIENSLKLKRPRQDEKPGNNDQLPFAKKAKRSLTQQLQDSSHAKPTVPNGTSGPMTNRKLLKTVASQSTSEVPDEVRHLASQYDLTPMSIISSSKMEHKIRNVLERIGKFRLNNAKAKPGVVILHSQARNASKMVTIAELSKREIEKEKDRWWQYTKLESQVIEMKAKPGKSKPEPGGKTLAKLDAEQKGDDIAEPCADTEMEGSLEEPITNEQPDDAGQMVIDVEEAEEVDSFDTMAAPTTRHRVNALSDATKTKVRAIPIMTIYLARVQVPGLRELYG